MKTKTEKITKTGYTEPQRKEILRADIDGLAKCKHLPLNIINESVASIVADLYDMGVDMTRIIASANGKW